MALPYEFFAFATIAWWDFRTLIEFLLASSGLAAATCVRGPARICFMATDPVSFYQAAYAPSRGRFPQK